MIDWKKLAVESGLTPEEFTKEVLRTAAAVGSMAIDAKGGSIGDEVVFTCSDEISGIELRVKRVNKEQQK